MNDIIIQLSADPAASEVLWDYCMENNFLLPCVIGELPYNIFGHLFYRTQQSGSSRGGSRSTTSRSESVPRSYSGRNRSLLAAIFPSLSGDVKNTFDYSISFGWRDAFNKSEQLRLRGLLK